MDEKEDTYSLGTIEVERYEADPAIALKFTSKEGRAKAIIRFSPEDCKTLIKKLTDSLK